MPKTLKKITSAFLAGFFALCVLKASVVLSYEINDKFSIEGMLTGVYQYGDFDVEGLSSTDRGAFVFDLGLNFHPTDTDEFQLTLSSAAGNGLNRVNPFSLAPYADDLEDDLKDINGRNRDYLLEAWYKRTFQFSNDVNWASPAGLSIPPDTSTTMPLPTTRQDSS